MFEILRDYLLEYEAFNDKDILVDILGAEADSFAIYQLPSPNGGIVRTFITGSSERQVMFEFATRFNYSDKRVQNVRNTDFFQKFCDWIETNNKSKELPEIETPLSLKVIATPYVRFVDPDGKQAEYCITLVYKYKKEA